MASKGFSEAVVSIDADSADIVVKSRRTYRCESSSNRGYCDKKDKIAPQNIVITPIRE